MRLVILFVVFLVAGIATGVYNARREYYAVEHNFGPYSEEENFESSQLEELLNRVANQGFSKLEVIGSDRHDFGVMHREEDGEHVFEIRNVGNELLNLRVTSSTCKCTVGELDSEWHKPGQIAQVRMKWTTKATGASFTQSATIETNDPDRRELKLTIFGKLVDTILLEPKNWSVGDVTSGKSFTLEQTAYNFTDKKIKLTKGYFRDPEVQALAEVEMTERETSEEKDGANRRALQAFDIKVVMKPGLRQGSMNHLFRVDFEGVDHEAEYTFFECRLMGEMVGPMKILAGSKLENYKEGAGYRLNIGKVFQGEKQVERVHISLRGDDYKDLKVEIGEVVPSDVFEVELGEENVRKTFKTIPMEIRVKPDAPLVKFDGNNPKDYGWVLLKPVDSNLSPLKLWLTIEVAKPE